jgi:predicted acyltransferase
VKQTMTGSQLRDRQSAAALRLVAAGVVLIFGGEAFCILGPHERIVHVSCHVALYAGMVLVAVGAVLHLTKRLRARRTGSS